MSERGPLGDPLSRLLSPTGGLGISGPTFCISCFPVSSWRGPDAQEATDEGE
jgi:hypothetical protein